MPGSEGQGPAVPGTGTGAPCGELGWARGLGHPHQPGVQRVGDGCVLSERTEPWPSLGLCEGPVCACRAPGNPGKGPVVRGSWVRLRGAGRAVGPAPKARVLLLLGALARLRLLPRAGFPARPRGNAHVHTRISYSYSNFLPVNEQTALTVSRLAMMIIDFNSSSSFLFFLREPIVSIAGGAGLSKRYGGVRWRGLRWDWGCGSRGPGSLWGPR